MRNCNDGIMLIKMPQFVGNGTYWVDYPGTIIDYNHIHYFNQKLSGTMVLKRK